MIALAFLAGVVASAAAITRATRRALRSFAELLEDVDKATS